MLVDLSRSEEEVMQSLRTSWFFLNNDFEKEYGRRLSEMHRIVEAAKIYVLDNYTKVSHWRDLWTTIRSANHEGPAYIHKKDVELRRERKARLKQSPPRTKRPNVRRLRSENMSDIFKELDKKTISPKSLTNAVYDWTDGDFSVKINGKWYNRINSQAIIDIASYIEEQLKSSENVRENDNTK